MLHQLTTDEAAFIKLHALTCVTVPNIQIHLEGQFPNRSFEYELIRRVRDHALDEKYGPDLVQMHDLFRKGDEIQKHGGLFVVDPSNEDFGMEAIHYQTSLFRRYALTYGVNQLKFVDGTHHLNRHKSTAIIWSGVDGLLCTKFMGVTFAFSEHSKPIIRGARLFPPAMAFLNPIFPPNPTKSENFLAISIPSPIQKCVFLIQNHPTCLICSPKHPTHIPIKQPSILKVTPIQSQSTLKQLTPPRISSNHPTTLLRPPKYPTHIPTTYLKIPSQC